MKILTNFGGQFLKYTLSSVRKSDHLSIQIANIIFLIASFFINILLSKSILDNQEFGIYNTMTTFMASLTTIFTAGLPFFAAMRYVKKEINDKDFISFFLSDLILSTLTFILLATFSNQITKILFSTNQISELIFYVGLALPSYVSSGFILAYINSKSKYKLQAKILIVSHIIKLISVIGFSLVLGIKGSILGYSLPGFVILIGFCFYLLKNKVLKLIDLGILKQSIRNFMARDMWLYVIPLTLFAFLSSGLLARDIILVENMLSKSDLNTYSIVTLFSRVPLYILQALGVIYFPKYAKSLKNEVKSKFARDLLLEFFISLLSIIAYIVAGWFVLYLFYGGIFANFNSNDLLLGAGSAIIYGLLSVTLLKFQAIKKQNLALVLIAVPFVLINIFGPNMIENFGLHGAYINIALSSLPSLIIAIIVFFLRH